MQKHFYGFLAGILFAALILGIQASSPRPQTILYDFYGHCDIIYLQIGDDYEVHSEGLGLVCKVKTLDQALREVGRALLDCPNELGELLATPGIYIYDDRDYPGDCLEIWDGYDQIGQLCSGDDLGRYDIINLYD